jgi:DeoR/GlpR family transcriptional regulator of sugar metabolism
VVADHTKWGVRGLCRFARLDEAHTLVSDAGLPAEARTVLGDHVEKLVVVPLARRRRAAAAGDGRP